MVKVEVLLTRSGTSVPYRTLHRVGTEECGFRPRDTTVQVLDGEPGVECQIDFAQMGLLVDPETGRQRKVHALIFLRRLRTPDRPISRIDIRTGRCRSVRPAIHGLGVVQLRRRLIASP